jgi:hypothetical protein
VSNFSDLEQFDSAFTPQQSGNFKPGLDALADGIYDFTILASNLDRTPKSNDLIIRVELRVEQTAQVVEFAYFLRDQAQADRLGGDLSILGFPVGTWTPKHGKKFSEELPKAVGQMRGLRFKAQKKANPSKNDPQKIYQNLYLQAKLSNADPHNLPATASATEKKDEIPF